jgi:serine/threonine protein kinase
MDTTEAAEGASFTDADSRLFGEVTEALLEKHRRGEVVDVELWCERYPAIAQRIRDLVPTLLLMEAFCDSSEKDAGGEAGPAKDLMVDQIGGYRIIRLIGYGGMSLVYEAEHELLGQRVALKVLPDHRAVDARASARFRREARAVAKLHHTNIVPILGVGQDGGRSFFVMPLIEGCSLQHLLDRLRIALGDSEADHSANSKQCDVPRPGTRASERWVAETGLQVAEALEYAHLRGVFHRDIKPSNLLVEASGRVWVSDFGLAKTDDDRLTLSGDIVGTVRYLAPERFTSSGDQTAGEYGDIYALGVTLYEMLTMRPAFPAIDRARLIAQILAFEPVRPSRIYPNVSPDLETVVLKAMAKEPAQRYRSASELADDLRRWLAGQPVLARRPAWSERTIRWARSNPTIAMLATALCILSVAGFTAVCWQWRESERLRRNEREAREKSEQYSQAILDNLDRLRRANELTDEARTKIENCNWDEAHERLTQAVSLQPDQAVFLESRGRLLYVQLGLWDLAAEDLNRAYKIHEPARAWEYWSQGLLRLWSDDRDGYRRVSQQVRNRFLGSSVPQAILETIRTLSLTPEAPEDMAEIAEAAERLLKPDAEAWHYYVVGLAYLRAGKATKAIGPLQKAYDYTPPWNSRGLVCPALTMAYFQSGDRERALQTLELEKQAFDTILNELMRDSDRRWCVHYDASGKWPLHPWDWLEWQILRREAYALLGQEPSRDGRLAALRGRSLCGLRRFGQGDEEYRRAWEQSPENRRIEFEMQRCRASLHLSRMQFADATVALDRTLQLDPNDCNLWRFQAVTCQLASKPDKYRVCCREMMDRFATTTDPESAYRLAFVTTLAPDAIDDYARLIPVGELASRWHPGAERSLGAIEYRAGRYEDALRHFEQSQLFHHRLAWDWAFVAMSQHHLGRPLEAREALHAARSATVSNLGRQSAWDDHAAAALLVAEAEALLQSP